jgi:RNA polymerase sigma-70 factor (ECF subfamily)
VLLAHRAGKTPATYALAALMCLHAARLPSRLDEAGNLTPLSAQDRSRWDRGSIREGLRLLEISAEGTDASEYHVEAAIAAVHARAKRAEDTDWRTIVSLYDTLMAVKPSPIVALNRAIAVAQSEGAERGLAEIDAIADRDRLANYPFYPAAIGELELRLGRRESARERFRSAAALARNPDERRFLEGRVNACERAEVEN